MSASDHAGPASPTKPIGAASCHGDGVVMGHSGAAPFSPLSPGRRQTTPSAAVVLSFNHEQPTPGPPKEDIPFNAVCLQPNPPPFKQPGSPFIQQTPGPALVSSSVPAPTFSSSTSHCSTQSSAAPSSVGSVSVASLRRTSVSGVRPIQLVARRPPGRPQPQPRRGSRSRPQSRSSRGSSDRGMEGGRVVASRADGDASDSSCVSDYDCDSVDSFASRTESLRSIGSGCDSTGPGGALASIVSGSSGRGVSSRVGLTGRSSFTRSAGTVGSVTTGSTIGSSRFFLLPPRALEGSEAGTRAAADELRAWCDECVAESRARDYARSVERSVWR